VNKAPDNNLMEQVKDENAEKLAILFEIFF
jgi:hypothetical protein